jgi:hypothetical protein
MGLPKPKKTKKREQGLSEQYLEKKYQITR